MKGDLLMSEGYGISYKWENCIQCHACEVACKSWRNVELGVRWRRVENIWQGSYPNIKNFTVSIACVHCVEPVCMEVCPEGAISKRSEDGVVVVDRDKCTGCRTCLEECPFEAPAFGLDEKMQKCDLCVNEIDFKTESPPCVETCPTNALVFGKMDVKEKIKSEESIIQLMKMKDINITS
jgi:anaerobic dimethyl sulfoxide reductase subunit B (iron-sulfur subunit)